MIMYRSCSPVLLAVSSTHLKEILFHSLPQSQLLPASTERTEFLAPLTPFDIIRVA